MKVNVMVIRQNSFKQTVIHISYNIILNVFLVLTQPSWQSLF